MKYFFSLLVALLQTSLFAQTPDSLTVIQAPVSTEPVSITLDYDSAFIIYNGIGPYSLEERAELISDRLASLDYAEFDMNGLRIEKGEMADDLFCGETLIMSISDEDARKLGLSRYRTGQYYLWLIHETESTSDLTEPEVESLALNIGIAILIIIVFAVGLRYFNKLFRIIYMKIHGQKGKKITGFRIKNYELLTEEKAVTFVIYAAKIIKIALLVLIIYLLLPLLFSLFPWTKGIATTLFGYILDPLKSMGSNAVAFIPNLLTIMVIWFVTRYVLRLLTFFKDEVAKGRLELPGFYPEWARPTANILKGLIIALAFIGSWPLLPMSDSDIFKGVSTFIGLLVALGGAGAISNVIAGLVITYMRSFKIGDRVRIGEVIGDVKEKSLLNTRIKTIKNEIITIPNSQMLNSHTINYTTANDEEGLILHTTITLGYDVPWRTVHKVLIEAALATEFVKKLPKPYVLQTSLDDFYVSYQLNARTREIHKMALIYSELHKNIQDKCNEAGIEILSPHYAANRDGNQSTMPAEYLPEDYVAPSFRFGKS